MKHLSSLILSLLLSVSGNLSATAVNLIDTVGGKRVFIAHRGVNLRSTIAGENSLEAIRLAKRAGFDAIETDVRLSSDDSLVVMHDKTLNRTCLTADGKKLTEETPVESLTWEQLRNNFKLKADKPENQEKISSLREYLEECKRCGMLVFIEPKLVDPTGRYYKRIMADADAVFGRGNYIITSNNRANNIIRGTLKIKNIPLMGILYQTTFDSINSLGNVIMAVSATRFNSEAYAKNVSISKKHNLLTESHSDKFKQFDMINNNDINIVSTDFLAPDLRTEATCRMTARDLTVDEKSELNMQLDPTEFGGLFLELECDGEFEITLCRQKFKTEGRRNLRHQVMVYNEQPTLNITGKGQIKSLKLSKVNY